MNNFFYGYMELIIIIVMCGIFAYIYDNNERHNDDVIKINGDLCQHRGPDNSRTISIDNNFLLFHRLIINDFSDLGNQPMYHPYDDNLILLCNGEIYNWRDLAQTYNITTKSTSDCEIILHMYKLYGIDKTIRELSGDFAFILLDKDKNKMYLGRDCIGVRPLYMGTSYGNKGIGIASEMKCLQDICNNDIWQVRPGCYYVIQNNLSFYCHEYYKYEYKEKDGNLKELLIDAVRKRLLSDRPFGCLLSGGLDSSLIASILVKYLHISNLHTFSIGMEGSEDLKYAREVSNYLGTIHNEYIVTEKEMLDAIEEVIYQIESYDVTTVRASVPMYLLAKWIRKNTDIKVLFSGEGSDELSGSYLYFKNAPSDDERQAEIIRLVKELHYFDVLRADKTISGAGLELRVPFLDKDFMEHYLGLPPFTKAFGDEIMEKHILRMAFGSDKALPPSVLFRQKEAFSDGVSSNRSSWFEVIAKYLKDNGLPDEKTYYKDIFNKYYPHREESIPHYWMPKWCGGVDDPSARLLKNHKINNKID